MNCEEAQHHLVDYFDKTLDTPTMTRVATHLISCPNCGAEAGELTDCIEQVAALPVVDPPIGFAQRVMAHVRELEEKPTIWQRMFAPWSKKIPIQIAAAALVGVMVMVLYPKEEQLKQRAMNESTTRVTNVETANAPNQPAVAAAMRSEKKEQIAAAPVPAVPQQVEPALSKKTLPAAPRAQSVEAVAPMASAVDENKAARRPPLQVQGVSNANEPSWFPSNRSGFGAGLSFGALPDSGSRSAALPLERSMTPLMERSADIEFVVHRRPSPRRDQSASSGTDSLRQSAEGEPAAPATSVAHTAPTPTAPRTAPIAEIRFYNVAPEHYELFKKDLASEAIIESETKSAAKESEVALTDRQLLIKVTILPPASESSTPSR